MTILGKSVDQNCTAVDGPCCHVGLQTDEQYDYEIGLKSSRANWSSLFETADAKPAAQSWNVGCTA